MRSWKFSSLVLLFPPPFFFLFPLISLPSSLSLFELRANIITKIEIEVKRLKKSQEWFRVEIPLASSSNGRSTQIFRFWFNKIFLAPSEKRIDSRSDRFFFFFFYHSYTTALPTCYVFVHECIWFWIVHQFYFNIYTLLFTQAAGSHEHSMVRASGTRPERFLSRS